MAINYRVVPNALTSPPSYTARYEANQILGFNEVATQINLHNPTIPAQTAKSVLEAFRAEVVRQIADGNTVKLPGFISIVPTMPIRLAAPGDPLPPDPIDIVAKSSRPFKTDIRTAATYNRLPAEVKTPTINSAYDTNTGIVGYVRDDNPIRIEGSYIRFDAADTDQGVFLLSSAGNNIRQDNVAMNDPSNVIVVPTLDTAPGPAGAASVEQVLSIVTKYTVNGQLRTGVYGKTMRTTNVVEDAQKKIFVVGSAVTGGATIDAYVGDQIMVRVVAQLKPTGELTLAIAPLAGSLGPQVTVTAGGSFVLTHDDVNDITVKVDDFDLVVESTLSYGRYLQEVCDLSSLTP